MGRPDESVVHGSEAPGAIDPNYRREAERERQRPQGWPQGSAQAKDLPSLDRLLRVPSIGRCVAAHGHGLVAQEARALLAARRETARAGGLDIREAALPSLADALVERINARLAPRLVPMLNLTGTVIHTNLGRAVLAPEVVDYTAAMMAAPLNLEFDLQTGGRGDRDSIVESLLCTLTGAEAATVVNNNAAAVLLTLAALAGGREAIVSRGELVEIGGAFRMPDVMAAAGARLIEVGTTNRTHVADYERAIGEQTALLMKVHTSNYAVQGFTSAVDEADLAPVARARGLPLVTDLGSGSLLDLARWGLPPEPTPQAMLRAGCDVVTFSGDKLLGGPQAGLIVGARSHVDRIRRHPLKRALRLSKLPLAALEATLRLYLQPETLPDRLPTLRWLLRPQAQIESLARTVQAPLAQALAPVFSVEVMSMQSQIGSGSLPIDRLPSAGLVLTPVSGKRAGRTLGTLAQALRALPRPVIGRIAEDRLWLDLRCLDEAGPLLDQLDLLRAALAASRTAAAPPHDGSVE